MGAKISAHPVTVELEVNHSSVCVKGHDASMLFGSAVKLIVGCHRPLDVSKASMLHKAFIDMDICITVCPDLRLRLGQSCCGCCC